MDFLGSNKPSLNMSLDIKVSKPTSSIKLDLATQQSTKPVSRQSPNSKAGGGGPAEAYSTMQSNRVDVKDLKFSDFMPLDEKTQKPVKKNQEGNLHFHMNLGSCYDSMIQEQMHSFVPKHKSYLKE